MPVKTVKGELIQEPRGPKGCYLENCDEPGCIILRSGKQGDRICQHLYGVKIGKKTFGVLSPEFQECNLPDGPITWLCLGDAERR